MFAKYLASSLTCDSPNYNNQVLQLNMYFNGNSNVLSTQLKNTIQFKFYS